MRRCRVGKNYYTACRYRSEPLKNHSLEKREEGSSLATLKGVAETTEETAVRAAIRGGRVLARRAGGDGRPVARSSSADVVDGPVGNLLLAALLALKLLVKGEDSLLGDGLDVACSPASAAESRGGLGQLAAEERGWTARGGS